MSYENYSVQRRLKHAKLKSRVRRFENRVCRVFKIIRFFLTIALFYALYRYASGSIWTMSDKMFTDGVNIEYSGNFIVSNKQIFNQIQKAAPENKYIYMFNPEKMQAEIEKLSPVKHAYVRRFIFPARLTVMIQEEIPALVIAENENSLETAAYSFDGVFIGNEYMPLLRKGRAVKVLASKEQYDEYSKWDDKKIMQLYRLAETAERNSGEKVLYIDLRQQNNVLIQLESVKVRIGKLDYDVFERVKKLNSIMKSDEIKGLLERINFIDLSWSQVQYLNIDK